MNALLSAAVVAALGLIAALDARTARIRPEAGLALVAAALAWHVFGAGAATVAHTWWLPLAGAALGAGMAGTVIAARRTLGLPLHMGPGDATLLAASGFLLGPLGLCWALVLALPAHAAHRWCFQRSRGRTFPGRLVPMAPGFAVGAVLVFGALTAGGAQASAGAVPLAASEVDVHEIGLPPALAHRRVTVDTGGDVPWIDAMRAVTAAAGVGIRIEERPPRIAGDAAELRAPPPQHVVRESTFVSALELVAAAGGYRWEWEDAPPAVVLYRYRDADWDLEPHVILRPPPAPVSLLPSGDASAAAAPPAAAAPVTGVEIAGVAPTPRAPEASLPAAASAGSGSAPVPSAASGRPAGGAGASPPAESGEGADAVPAADGPEAPPEAAGDDADRDPAAAPAAPDAAAGGEPPPEPWVADPAEHGTLRQVLDAWTARAGWSLVWLSARDFTLRARAEFDGDLLDAAGLLLADGDAARTIAVEAFPINRQLVIADAGRFPQ